MIAYDVPRHVRVLMCSRQAEVKAALCKIANAHMEMIHPAAGIAVHEGGVRVNGRDIVIRRHEIRDLANTEEDIVTAEENAVAEAVHKVSHIIQTQGIGALSGKYGACDTGEPLRGLVKTPPPRYRFG